MLPVNACQPVAAVAYERVASQLQTTSNNQLQAF